MVWGENGRCIFGAFVFDDGDYLWDDFAGLFDFNGVAYVEVTLADHAVVVEGGVLDLGAGEEDGFEGGAGGDFAGLTDLMIDGEEFGGFAFGGELVSDDPAGGFTCVAQGCLLGEGVDADDDAVGCVVEVVAELVDVVDCIDDLAGGGCC